MKHFIFRFLLSKHYQLELMLQRNKRKSQKENYKHLPHDLARLDDCHQVSAFLFFRFFISLKITV